MPTTEENKELCRRFFEEVFNGHSLDYAEESMADDLIEHQPFPGMSPDKKGALDMFRAMFEMSSDMKAEIVNLIASGDRVAIHSVSRGTDTGGAMGTPPTNKPYEMASIDIVRVNDEGKFAEHWGITDTMTMMGQLGLLPPPPEG